MTRSAMELIQRLAARFVGAGGRFGASCKTGNQQESYAKLQEAGRVFPGFPLRSEAGLSEIARRSASD